MQNNIVLSVGYPIGMIKDKDNYKFYVECEFKEHILDDKESFEIWKVFLGGKYYLQGEKEILNDLKCTDEICIYVFNKLRRQGLLLELEGNVSRTYNQIKDKKLFRQGIGIGCSYENDVYYVVLGKLFELNSYEYSIWVMADRRFTIEKMMERICSLNEISKEYIINIVLNLYNKGLVYLY